MVMEVVQEEVAEGSIQCTDHPYKNSTPSPGGICAFCLQEKLGKLVSSSFSAAVFPSVSSSPSPSFRSEFTNATAAAAAQAPSRCPSSNPRNRGNDCSSYASHHQHRTTVPRLPFVLTKNRKKKDGVGVGGAMEGSDPTSIVFKRSKSVAAPKGGILNHTYGQDHAPHRRGFWSFLKHSTPKKTTDPHLGSSASAATAAAATTSSMAKKTTEDHIIVTVDENGSPDEVSFDRKVSRSRSVGCGSRSFSGDFFAGFGDCTLRRVESHREGKPKVQPINGPDFIKQRVSCGGIFSGFMVNSSSSLSSSHWVASTGEVSHHMSSNGRTRSWGWALAFASPMRTFSNKPSGTKRIRGKKNTSPNLAAIPSLLAANG